MTKNKNFLQGLFGKRQDAATETGADEAAAASTAHALTDGVVDAETVPPTDSPPLGETLQADKESTAKPGIFARLRDGLARSSQRLSEGFAAIVSKRKLDAETLDELEELLIAADLGVAAAGRVREDLKRDKFDKEITDAELKSAVAAVVSRALAPREAPLVIDSAHKPHVILTVGVNGAGKTTTIGKLAAQFRKEGRSVVIAAGDTFRAAAVEQLTVWGERAGVEVIARETGADAAGLAFEALEKAKAAGADVLLIDTAGRLQNRRELMDELAKIVRVLKKLDPSAPHDTLLILDATVGQNAISQADAFREIAGVTGLVMTKLDGTARGGVLVALADRHPLPIHFIGVGEAIDDLQPFSAAKFAEALAGLSTLTGRG